ncbi:MULTISPECIES: hypothetical protein [Vibrio harveyi group]|uniref:Uncharacterized protein n=1 Tax=Vibrio owensii CAIM 1854 = LMG 25443 TaxID=1229493 RepID=A0A0C1VT20_9VIBR|nr:hypothetical protein [Vibrio owensii]KIF53063.1 hypothetical protein H735_08930 [Vibrio owensii CAIM 1854 = LMG 25443]
MKFVFEKNICLITAFVIIAVGVADWSCERLTIIDALSLGFSTWLCAGSWHVLDFRERNPQAGIEYIHQLYLWPKRYFKRKAKDI